MCIYIYIYIYVHALLLFIRVRRECTVVYSQLFAACWVSEAAVVDLAH